LFSKLFKFFIMLSLIIGFASYSVQTANAATKIMWGKTELKIGQIGKVTILSNTNLVKMASNGSLTTLLSVR
jgi:hypothetical protein